MVAGSYEGGLRAVLPVVLIGLVWLITCSSRPPQAAASSREGSCEGPGLRDVAVLYAAGWACRLLVGGGFENPLTSSAMGLAPLAAILAVLALGRLPRGPAWLPAAAALCGEGLWSWLYASKTPVLAVLLAIGLKVMLDGRLRKNALRLGTVAGLGAVVFTLVQVWKNELSSIAEDVGRVDATYPAWAQPLLPVLRRFDLLSGTTDAVLLGPGQWVSTSVGQRLVRACCSFGTGPETLSRRARLGPGGAERTASRRGAARSRSRRAPAPRASSWPVMSGPSWRWRRWP